MLNEYYNILTILYRDIDFIENWKVYPVRFEPNASWYIEGNTLFFTFPEDDLDDNEEERILLYPAGDDNWTEYEILKPWRFYEQVIYEGKEYTGILVDTCEDGNIFLMIFSNKNKEA